MDRTYLSWGSIRQPPPRHVARPAFTADAWLALREPSVLACGLRRSYGDSCLNPGGVLIDTRRLDRLLAFDRESGVLEVEAGVTLAEILLHLSRTAESGRTWFLPVSPGTKFVTVGGAIANDVHGKNHHMVGCFGNHVRALRLLRSDGRERVCSPTQEPALFNATIGGLGLTGLVLSATLQMRLVPSLWLEVEHIRTGDLAAFDRLSTEAGEWEYTVAWADCLRQGESLGRGIFTRARHIERAGPPPEVLARPRHCLSVDLPRFVLRSRWVAALNALYWRRASAAGKRSVVSYEKVLYPLDALGQWNRVYGACGFHQYQCVIPTRWAAQAIPELLRATSAARQGSFLTVLKTLGCRVSPGMLSFPMQGTTLALDFPNLGASTFELLDRLDAISAAAEGRIYPAKDGRVAAADFQRGYPNWRDFECYVDPHFSSSFWRRVSARQSADA